MPAPRGGFPGGPAIILLAAVPLVIVRVTGGGSWWLIGMIAAQTAAIAWMLSAKLEPLSRGLLAAAAAVVPATTIAVLGLPARAIGIGLSGLCHAAAYAGLLVWFAASLRADHVPIVTQLAHRMRRSMPDEVMRYTRQVTVAWCVFFAGQLLASGALLIAAPAIWASFVTLWNLPLITAMVLAEFICRMILIRRDQRSGLLATLAGVWRARGVPGRAS